jgi:hypothetical protein
MVRRPLSNRLRDTFDALSLRTRLVGGFAVLLVLLADGVSVLSHQRVQDAFDAFLHGDNRIAERSDDARAALLRARRSEKDFLLRVRELGYEEARSRYLTLVQDELAGVRAVMAEVRQLARDDELAAEAQAVTVATQAYEQGFVRVVALQGLLGRRDTGLEGRLVASAHALETLLQAPGPVSLQLALHGLRRLEKNYLLHRLRSDTLAFRRDAEALQAAITQAALPPPRRQALQAQLQIYGQAFADYVEVSDAIAAAQQQYLAAVHRVEPSLDRPDLRAGSAKAATQATL